MAVKAEQERYYAEHWHRVLYQLIGYKNPSVANADLYSLLSLRMNTNEPIFFHVDFMKPGKNIYLIEQAQP